MQRRDVKAALLVAVLGVSVLLAAPALAVAPPPPLTGAVWTTLCDGSRVDHNVYAAKEDVYLNGGPYGESGAWVPDGDYYFMVTDPPGKILLSEDPVTSRMIRIEDGKVLMPDPVPPYTDHNWCDDLSRAGNHTIQLMPYSDSPNGEYKMWLTRFEDYNTRTPNKFGFSPALSKTDNFRVRRGRVCITGHKWNDLDGDGVWDGGEPPLAGWLIVLSIKKGNNVTEIAVSETALDGSFAFCVSEKGNYRLSEVLQEGWEQTWPVDPGYHVVNVSRTDLRNGAEEGPYDFGNWNPPPPPVVRIAGLKYREVAPADSPDFGVFNLGTDEILGDGWCFEIWPGHFDDGTFVPDVGVEDEFGVVGPWTVCTNAQGAWEKGGLPVGPAYQVCEVSGPAGWSQVGPADQTLSVNVWAEALCWYYVSGEPLDPNSGQLHFGNISDCGRIIVFKYWDKEGDGVFNNDDVPLPGWLMFLYDEYGRVTEWDYTDENGLIEFPLDEEEALGPGCYKLGEMKIPDWHCTTCTIGIGGVEVCIDAVDCVGYVEFGNYYESHTD